MDMDMLCDNYTLPVTAVTYGYNQPIICLQNSRFYAIFRVCNLWNEDIIVTIHVLKIYFSGRISFIICWFFINKINWRIANRRVITLSFEFWNSLWIVMIEFLCDLLNWMEAQEKYCQFWICGGTQCYENDKDLWNY